MIVLNTGVPRSGTVLTNAIIRGVLAHAGVAVTQANPHGDALPDVITRLTHSNDGSAVAHIVHTHSWDKTTEAICARLTDLHVFSSYRDPRDVCVSLMRLHDLDLDAALRMTIAGFALFEATCSGVAPVVIQYERLIAGKRSAIETVAQELALQIDTAGIMQIDEATSVSAHRQIVDAINRGELPNLVARQNRSRILYEDPVTLINDRHIQSGAIGRWQSELAMSDQERLCERLRPLTDQYGWDAGP
ncbi:MAG: hypothetical protein AAGC81_17450 [Pseudomonadota bacterium]